MRKKGFKVQSRDQFCATTASIVQFYSAYDIQRYNIFVLEHILLINVHRRNHRAQRRYTSIHTQTHTHVCIRHIQIITLNDKCKLNKVIGKDQRIVQTKQKRSEENWKSNYTPIC